MLLMMAATLCSHAITACTEHKIDADVLANGFSFFTGPLLSWTLVGVVKTLVREVKQTRCINNAGDIGTSSLNSRMTDISPLII